MEPNVESQHDTLANLAPQYSQLCGILAGFAFVGFTIYLASPTLPGSAASVTASLFAAFATLTLLAILYALMSADSAPNRIAIGLFVYGLPFGLTSITLFYTLTLMALRRPELHATAQIGRVFVLVIGPAIVLARMRGGALSLNYSQTPRTIPRWFETGLIVTLAAVGICVMLWPRIVGSLSGHGVFPAYIALGSAVPAGILSPIIANQRADVAVRRAWVDLYMVIGFIALGASTAIAAAAIQ